MKNNKPLCRWETYTGICLNPAACKIKSKWLVVFPRKQKSFFMRVFLSPVKMKYVYDWLAAQHIQ